MAWHVRDYWGMPIGTIKSDQEIRDENEGCAIGALFLLGTWPMLFAAYSVYSALREQAVHTLFSLIAAAAAFGFLMWLLLRFRILRGLYFGIYTVVATLFIFSRVVERSDPIWASAAALVVFAIGGFVTWLSFRRS